MNEKVVLSGNENVEFTNNVDYCVGTGRLGLALTKEYLEQLKFVQEKIGFKYIRGHGLFSDDVSIYHEYEEDGQKKVEYNYTYIDRIFDEYLKVGIRPYLELGFMPGELASGDQTIFYWKGNTTPPKEYKLWTDMVIALLKHLKDRYGESVTQWPIEVWNEPNLPGFWKDADKEEYFKLFKETFLAIKEYDDRFKVGGPAICGVKDEEWIKDFLDFCKDNELNPDYITRHHYTVEFPTREGHYDYSKLEDAEMRIENLMSSRRIIDSYDEFKNKPMHITEFSTSYTPKGVIHDTNINAAYLAEQISRLGDMNELYSYWTFGDVFEEQGVPFSLFHGGFGMLANDSIPKPTFWTFYFYKQLQKKAIKCVFRDKTAVVTKTDKGYAGIMWNYSEEEYVRELEFDSDFTKNSENATLIIKYVDEESCNPLKVWHDLGEPPYPDEEMIDIIKSAAYPQVCSEIVSVKDNKVNTKIRVRKNGVVYFELIKRDFTPDRGYDYEKVISFH